MSGLLVDMVGVRKAFLGIIAVDGIDLGVRAGERLALIGPNGLGKTTLMNCLAGRNLPTNGVVRFDKFTVARRPAHRRARLGIARTFRLPQPFPGLAVAENVMVPLEFLPSNPGRQTLRARALDVLASFGLANRADACADVLTQVDLRKLGLARAVTVQPKLLIANEAMAGLPDSEVDDVLLLLKGLSARGIAIILIEHIMRAVTAFAERIVCLETGRKIADGTPAAVLRDPQVEKAYLGG